MSLPNAEEQYLVELVNAARLNEGYAALAVDDALMSAAQGHAGWMAANDTMSHTGEGGSGPGDRIAAAGYEDARTWGENVAWRTGTLDGGLVAVMHEGWMESPGHRENILSANFDQIGVGLASTGNKVYGTEDFGNHAGGPSSPGWRSPMPTTIMATRRAKASPAFT